MKETTVKLIKQVEKLEKLVAAEFIVSDMSDDMNETATTAMMAMLSIVSLTKKLALEQAEMMEDIDEKLNRLLSKQEKGLVRPFLFSFRKSDNLFYELPFNIRR